MFLSGGAVLAAGCPWADWAGHSHWSHVEWLPFGRGFRPMDVAQNLLLCVPLGASAAWVFKRGQVAAFTLSLVLSCFVEATQLYGHNRFPSATDVVCNVAGALAAAAVARRWVLRA